MPIMRWQPLPDPFREFDKFFDDFGLSNSRQGRAYLPAVDVYQDEKSVTVEASLPGIDPDQINVSVENDTLILEGKSEKKSEVDEQNYYRKEVSFGAFHRVIPLPTAVQSDAAQATYEQGILKVVVPKETKARSNKIKVEVKSK